MRVFRIHLTSYWIYKSRRKHTGVWDLEMIKHLGKRHARVWAATPNTTGSRKCIWSRFVLINSDEEASRWRFCLHKLFFTFFFLFRLKQCGEGLCRLGPVSIVENPNWLSIGMTDMLLLQDRFSEIVFRCI